MNGVRPRAMPPILTSAFAGVEVKVISTRPLLGAGAGVESACVDAATGAETKVLATKGPGAAAFSVPDPAFLKMA